MMASLSQHTGFLPIVLFYGKSVEAEPEGNEDEEVLINRLLELHARQSHKRQIFIIN